MAASVRAEELAQACQKDNSTEVWKFPRFQTRQGWGQPRSQYIQELPEKGCASLPAPIVAQTIPLIPTKPNWPCHEALRHAIMTDKKFWPAKTKTMLKPLLEKYL